MTSIPTKRRLICLLASALLSLPSAAYAHNGLQWELRASFAGTVEPLGSEDLGSGFGLEGNLAYEFVPHVSVYAGWSWHRFWNDRYYRLDPDIDTEESGYVLGLQWQDQLLGWPSTEYRLRAGITRSRLRFEDFDRSITESNNANGWELGAALVTTLAHDWKITQALRYRAQRRAVPLGAGGQADLRYFSLTIGVARSF